MSRLLKGETVKEISSQLSLKPTTVATYKARIFEKMGVNNLMDLNNIADLNNYQIN
jgi:DNA-binding NarL/FixJ family response regulator